MKIQSIKIAAITIPNLLGHANDFYFLEIFIQFIHNHAADLAAVIY